MLRVSLIPSVLLCSPHSPGTLLSFWHTSCLNFLLLINMSPYFSSLLLRLGTSSSKPFLLLHSSSSIFTLLYPTESPSYVCPTSHSHFYLKDVSAQTLDFSPLPFLKWTCIPKLCSSSLYINEKAVTLKSAWYGYFLFLNFSFIFLTACSMQT